MVAFGSRLHSVAALPIIAFHQHVSRTGDIDEVCCGDRGGNGRRMVRRRDPIHGSAHDECRCAAEGSVGCCAIEVRDRVEETRQDWQLRRVDEASQGGRLLCDGSPYWLHGADCGGADRSGKGGMWAARAHAPPASGVASTLPSPCGVMSVAAVAMSPTPVILCV